MNNDIRPLVRSAQIRLVNLDLDSPRMREAMLSLGYEKEDLDTRKRKEHFRDDPEGECRAPSPKGKDPLAASKDLKFNTIDNVNEELVKIRYKHYQDRLMDKINRALNARKQIKIRKHTRDTMIHHHQKNVFSNTSIMTPVTGSGGRPLFHSNKEMGVNMQKQMRSSQTSFDKMRGAIDGLPKLKA
mgnify:FL=1